MHGLAVPRGMTKRRVSGFSLPFFFLQMFSACLRGVFSGMALTLPGWCAMLFQLCLERPERVFFSFGTERLPKTVPRDSYRDHLIVRTMRVAIPKPFLARQRRLVGQEAGTRRAGESWNISACFVCAPALEQRKDRLHFMQNVVC